MLDGLPILNKIFDLQISVIKSAKINRYFKEMQDNYQIQMQSLLNQQIKKEKKHWLMLKNTQRIY
jgi:hypothetical protein